MKIEINIPPDVNLNLSEFDYKMILGVSLCEKDYMSSGLAAEILGIPRADFLRNMGRYGMSIFENLTEEAVKKEAKVAVQYAR